MKKIILLAALFLTFASTESFADILNKEDFTKEYASALMKLYPDAKIETVGELEVRITLADNNEMISFLDNAYADYQNTPGEIKNILKTYSESLDLSKKHEQKRFGKEHIFPVIKNKSYIQQVEEIFKKTDKKALVYEKLNDVLYVLYAFDTPKAIRFMTEDDLSSVGVEKSELREIAKSNLIKAIPNLRLEGNPAGLSMLVADGTYEASFILFDSIWSKDRFPVKGDIVVYIPSRDSVLITGSEDKTNLANIHNIIYNPENQWSHIVTGVGFIRVDGTWKIYQP